MKEKPPDNLCEYFQCKHREKKEEVELFQCPYCEDWYCEAHRAPKEPGMPNFRDNSRAGRERLERWRREDAHPCAPYVKIAEEEYQKTKEEEHSAMKRFLDTPSPKPRRSIKQVKKPSLIVYPPSHEVYPPINKPSERKRGILFLTEALLFIFLGIAVASEIISPLSLTTSKIDMVYVIGNPKPLYIYDIESNCQDEGKSIDSSLYKLSTKTNVQFYHLPYPIALLVGGLSYSCSEAHSYGAIGESEAGSGYVTINWMPIPFAWNVIRLSSIEDDSVTIHETLHSMGFDHSNNPDSIMYPYNNSQEMDAELISFIKTVYASNPYAYLNLIPLNLLVAFLVLVFLLLRRDSK